MEKELSLYVTEDKSGRIDSYIAEKAHISRTMAQKLITDGMVILNETAPSRSSTVKEGDIIHVRIPMVKDTGVEQQDIPIDIVYDDEHIVVINKQRGMVVHPSAGHKDKTLVNALLYHVEDLSGVGGEERPGIVHRLDKNTSGLLIIAKDDNAHQKLSSMFQFRKIHKEYIAIVKGKLRGHQGVIDLPLGRDPKNRTLYAIVSGGKNAVTQWKIKKSYSDYTLVYLFPETGRTHQLRVHLKHIGCPILGDPEYGGGEENPFGIKGQALHSHKLSFKHPVTEADMELTAPLPEDMQHIVNCLEKGVESPMIADWVL